MGTRRSKHNYGRKPRYKENGAEVCKAIWETPDFFKEPEPTHPQEAKIHKLLSEGDSVREITEKLQIDKNIVRNIRAKGIRSHPEWNEASRNRARERSVQRLANEEFRALLSQKQKHRWHERKAADAALTLPEDEKSAAGILAKYPRNGWQYDKWLRWSKDDVMRLEVLAAAGIDPTRAASVFKRSEKTIAYKARDAGIYIPPSWSAFLPKPKYVPHPRGPVVLLNYPFAVKATAENEEILAVNKMVPKSWPEEMRGDVCQEIMLHVYQGKINLETLRGPRGPELVRQYGRHWRNENNERGGYGMMKIYDLDDDRSYEDVAAAREWDWNCMNEKRLAFESFQAFTPATQFHEVYEKEVDKECLLRAEMGVDYSREQVEADLESGKRFSTHKDLVAERVKIARFALECGFELCNARDADLTYKGEARDVGRIYCGADAAAYQTQYVYFRIPKSATRVLKIRIGDHAQKNAADLDTHKLGVDGVMKVLAELSGNVGKYEKVYNKWGGMQDLLNDGLEGFSDVA